MQVLSRQRGVSLIEVLVSVLIFSIGLVGLAGLLVMATRSNHAAYLRTQVTFLADGMADRMRANPMGVWGGAYNRTDYPAAASTAGCSAGCTPTELATYDRNLWSSQLRTFLPNPTARIDCAADGAGYAPSSNQLAMRPPYGGSCAMHISWSERGAGDGAHRAAATQTFDWEFQP